MSTAALTSALGQAIRQARKFEGLTLEQLAERVGGTANWLGKVERGAGQPTLHLLGQIAEATSTTPEALLRAALAHLGRPEESELAVLASRLQDRDLRILLATARAAAEDE